MSLKFQVSCLTSYVFFVLLCLPRVRGGKRESIKELRCSIMTMEAKMSESKFKPPEEWFRQADYDLETAEAMFKAGRYIYTVFMCHLSIEKALKGLYAKRFRKDPPKIHNLN